jgi:hypothetical protein
MAVEIVQIDPTNFNPISYGSQETNLISSFGITTFFTTSSYIELHIYDLNSNLLTSNLNYTQYTVLNDGQSAGTGVISQIEIDLEQALGVNQIGSNDTINFDTGEYITYFNFLNQKIGSEFQTLYITEINSDRTEIRLDSTSLTDLDIVEQTNNFVQERENSEYFLDFYINFGENNLFIANNIVLDNQDPTNPTILVKLYEPLPEEYDLNSQLWIVTSIEEPIAYNVSIEEPPITIVDTLPLSGPNFNLDLKDQVNNSTLALSYDDLTSTSVSSSLTQIITILDEREIGVNIDFSNFSNFIHFSSAKSRLENFAYKVQLIEQYSSSLSAIDNITGATSSSIAVNENKIILQSKIDNIINNFDVYDYYLYYSEGPWAWPKTNSTPPYVLELPTSPAVLNWFGSTDEFNPYYGGVILSASLFDNNNKDNLKFSTPEYLRDDPNNAQYELFIDMVAQHFDNIWIYYKDTINKYNNDNRLDYGISKDLVADAIRDFGVKLYQNNFSNQDLYTAFLGLTPDGALFPFPEITGSLPTPTGFEYVDLLISASNDYIPLDDVNKSLYKRIYHNLPYLLKSKGTLPGLRALITSYGIPDTILRINEYGGKDKVNSNDWDYWQNEFNYAFKTEGNNFISSSFTPNSAWPVQATPESLFFRFKTNGLPETNIPYSQSLFSKQSDTAYIVLRYTGSGYISGSYSGSIIDPYYQYAHLDFYPSYNNDPTISASIYLPFFDGGWWSVMVNANTSSNPSDYDFSLYAANKIYEGGDNGTILGFIASSSITTDGADWDNNGDAYFVSSSIINGNIYTQFSGSLQEIRYYANPINENVFKDYVMNPYSIEGNSLNSGPNKLIFRASLGGELYTGSVSTHPKVTGSWVITSSFASDSNFYFNSTPVFVPNIEYFFYDQPIAGIKNAVSDKIRLENDSLPSGSVLSPLRALSQITAASASYTPSINLLEVALSPQDEINDDINSSLGFFNIGDYIGDPAFRSSQLQSYPNLDNLRNSYFEKYTKNYDLVDFVRLIKFFDNSLFKMIKDFVPARTSLASGIVIKQHLLERNRYPQPQVDPYSTIAYTTSGSTNNTPLTYQDISISGTLKPQWNDYNPGTVENFNGGTAGSFEIFNGINTSPYGAEGDGPDNIFGITQSWSETYSTPLGLTTVVHDSQEEFYDGEFSGSVILVTTQSLNQPYSLENASFEYTPILYKNSLYGESTNSTFTEGQFLNSLTTPNQGEILILAPRYRVFPLSPTKGLAFIKINKIDANGVNNTNALGQLTNLLIQYTTNTTYENYEILNINEYPNYYLYEVNRQDIPLEGLGIDNEIKNYYISASRTGAFSNFINSSITTLMGYDAGTLGNTLGYFDSSSGIFTLQNTPNIPLHITASIPIDKLGSPTGDVKISIVSERNGIKTLLHDTSFNAASVPLTLTLTSSFIPLNGDQIYIQKGSYGGTGGTLAVTTASILITQSISPTASVQDSIILEPYITQPNFYNSDQNALLNNAFENRLSTLYQDVDYSTGLLVPTNFNALIDGTATKAAVQDSNYTTKRHIIPRYEGSKSTSQFLNKWTRGDEGTYGKLPSVESSKTYIAYSDSIGGYAPEKMNTSGVSIKYLISEDGDLIAPNTSLNSLGINQQTFVSGEKVELQSLTAGGFTQNPKLNIFRGGSSIEPIIYNQIKHPDNPVMTFTQSLIFSDRNPSSSATINDYTATLSPNDGSTLYPVQTAYSGILNDQILSSGSSVGGALSVTSAYSSSAALIAENLDLIFEVNLKVVRLPNSIGTVYARVFRTRGGVNTPLNEGVGGLVSSFLNINFTVTVPRADLQVNDLYGVQMIAGQTGTWYRNDSTFKISTNPYPTPPLNISNLWLTSSTPGVNSNVILTTSSKFIQYLNSSNIYQEDIDGSGFFPITLPVSIQRGDEFRFEGDETKTFMVDNVIISSSANIPFAAVYLDKQISGSNINVNEFLLRRYVDNPAGLLLDGLKPSNFDQPYLIKPEYMSEKMEQNIGKYIEDFTSKGLL